MLLKGGGEEIVPKFAFSIAEPIDIPWIYLYTFTVYSESQECQTMVFKGPHDPMKLQSVISIADLIIYWTSNLFLKDQYYSFLMVEFMQAGNTESHIEVHPRYETASQPTYVYLPWNNVLWLQGGDSYSRSGYKIILASTIITSLSMYKFTVGPTLPIPLVGHCSVPIQGGKQVFISGGITTVWTPNNKSFIYNFETETWKVIDSKSPCGSLEDSKVKLSCELLGTSIIIPSFDIEAGQPCTALFDINSHTWSMLKNDQRLYPSNGGLVLNDGILYHLGGTDEYGNGTKIVYKLVNKSHWQLLSGDELPVTVGGKYQLFAAASMDYCTGKTFLYDHREVITKRMLGLDSEYPMKEETADYKKYKKLSKLLENEMDKSGNKTKVYDTDLCKDELSKIGKFT